MSYSVGSFSEDQLYRELAGIPCIWEDAKSNPRAKYLFDYLRHLGATTIVTETGYIDADYLDDFASFYVKSFADIPNRCRRLHFFTNHIDAASFELFVTGDTDSGPLQDGYLGFIVARPLPSAIIGRTVVKTYPSENGRRNYTCLRTYHVNLFGIELSVESLAFQEQDTSLAACATVALWSCFQKTRDMFNSGLPSPVVITRASNQLLRSARPFPSRGLTIEQVCNAIASVGPDPEVYPVQPDLPLVSMAYSYLRLGVPVLLIFKVENIGLHGVALNGYSMRPSRQLAREGGSGVLPFLVGSRIDEFYSHDDQAGPFSKLKIIEAPDEKSSVRFAATNWKGDLTPCALVVPVNPKIRTGFREVISWIPRLSVLIGFVRDATQFEWDIHLTSSNQLKKLVREDQNAVPADVRTSLLIEGLPKYLWRCILSISTVPASEMLLDTTAMVRGFPVLRIWWPDEALKKELGKKLQGPVVGPILAQVLTTRLYEKVIASFS